MGVQSGKRFARWRQLLVLRSGQAADDFGQPQFQPGHPAIRFEWAGGAVRHPTGSGQHFRSARSLQHARPLFSVAPKRQLIGLMPTITVGITTPGVTATLPPPTGIITALTGWGGVTMRSRPGKCRPATPLGA